MTELLTQARPVSEASVTRSASHDEPQSAIARYAEAFVHTFRVNEPGWLNTFRRAALQQLDEKGFPTTRDEDWHFTNPAPITSRTFLPADTTGELTSITAAQIAPYTYDADWHTLVFVNGRFAPTLSQYASGGEHYTIGNIASMLSGGPRVIEQHLGGLAPANGNAFSALNSVFMHDGLLLIVRPNVVIDRPIHVIHVTDASVAERMVSPRTLIIAEHHAAATGVESFVTVDEAGNTGVAHFTNAVSEVYLSPGARVRHYKIQREALGAFHVGSVCTYQQQDSHYESFSFATGAALSRTNISTVLDGPGAHTTMNGLYMVSGSQTVDHQTRIEHAKERCTSHEVYRGILDDTSHAVFNGKVYVRPEAQQTDGKQSNNNLLLSERAHIDTKPQLEIFADDVKCTHGATVGRLDPTSMFYMKSRGVGEDIARRLLTYAFAADVLEQITVEPVKQRLEELTFERFAVAP